MPNLSSGQPLGVQLGFICMYVLLVAASVIAVFVIARIAATTLPVPFTENRIPRSLTTFGPTFYPLSTVKTKWRKAAYYACAWVVWTAFSVFMAIAMTAHHFVLFGGSPLLLVGHVIVVVAAYAFAVRRGLKYANNY